MNDNLAGRIHPFVGAIGRGVISKDESASRTGCTGRYTRPWTCCFFVPESSPLFAPETHIKVVDFWFGKDLARLADDKDYAQSYSAKWFGTDPPDEAFVGTQKNSEELIKQAARCVGCVFVRDADGF